MPEYEVSPNQVPQVEEAEQEATQDDKEYGCIFCITGREFAVAQRLEKAIPGLKAISPVKLRYRRMERIAHEEKVILFPGYVFFEVQAGSDVEIRTIYNDQDVLKVLYVDDEKKDWRLGDPDKSIAEQFFNMNGVIGFSEAYFDEENRIHIVKGFLKEHEGKISRINKKAKTAEMQISIGNQKMTLWIGYVVVSNVKNVKL